MSSMENTGIFFKHPGNGSTNFPDLEILKQYAESIDGVVKCWQSHEELPDSDWWTDQIIQENIKRVILAGYKPGTIKPMVARAMNLAGEDPKKVLIARFSNGYSDRGKLNDIAKQNLYSVIADEPVVIARKDESEIFEKSTLVIGAGIAGIQSSLEIANANEKVYLLERTGTIGGHMAMFDKTFPTLDCAACILTPKMVEVGQHPNIELLTYSEVQGISGEFGNFKVRVLKKARRVDLAKCIGCGNCSEKCPAKASSEFDAGTTLRKAIYIPFPQAVPNKYLIDAEHCTYVKNGKCGVCVKTCPVENCIDLDEKDETIEINVGSIIISTGFKTFDAGKIQNLGYGKYPNVVTSLEFERLINASGPTEGMITYRTKDKKGNNVFTMEGESPASVGIVHCVGSRDENHNKYCSRVCCMYSLKLAHLVKEKLPDAEVFEYYIDMRAFGKGYEEFYNRIKEEGVHIIRGKTAKIEESGDQLLVRSEDIINSRILEHKLDMVILAVGLEPREESVDLANMFGIDVDENGWFKEADYNINPSGTRIEGITIAGACQGPKDIPDSVAQGAAAASKVLQSLIHETV
jgi:heterodisulfide reductase subunit A